MNWIKENKFLSGYIAVLAIGLGVFGYLLYSANAHYSDVAATYDTDSTELDRLQHLPLFPNAENLKKLEDEKQEHLAKVDELHKKLATQELPLEPMTPEQFQDKLQAAVKAFIQKTTEAGIKLPDKFYLGFDRYETEPPKPDAAPLLGRELKAVQFILDTLVSSSMVELKNVSREELPEEKGVKSEAAGRGGPPRAAASKTYLAKNGLQVEFMAPRGSTQTALNELVANQTQFIIPRLITAHNEKDKGPPRNAPAVAAAPPPPPPPTTPQKPGLGAPASPTPDATTTPPEFIVGDELVDTIFRLEIVNFTDPSAPQTAAAPK